MPDVSFSDFVTGLAVDTLSGVEKIPLLDGTTSRHATAALLAAFTVDQLHQASVITTLNDSDEMNVFQSDIEKILTAQNFFSWVVDKLEAITTGTTIVDGDKLVFNDGGVLKQIDIADVRTFLNSSSVALGAQIAALSTATLADSDQYVVAQSSTALKTTFSAIAARVHAQFLAYTASLPAIATLADADTFYASDSGVASKVTAQTIATYVQAEVGAAIVSAAWDTYSALGAAANATDVFLLERSSTGRTATGANIATYVIGTQDSASDGGSVVAGDDFLIFRSGTQYKMDVGALSTYVLASGWSATSGSPVATGDKIVIGRGGTTYSVTVDQLKTFALVGIQASVLDITGLASATLASGNLFLIGDGATAKKATLAELETKLWADYGTYVAALTAHTSLADANTFYVLDGSTPKKITAANMAVYMDAELWDKADASPAVQAGDDLWMRRSTTSYKLDVDALATYIGTAVTSSIDIAALATATLSDADLFMVDDGGTNKKVALSDLRTHLWVEFENYVSALTSAVTPVDADLIYMINTGAPRQLTVGDLWDNRYLADAKAIKLDDFTAPDDNTDLNATTSAHGLLPKLANNTVQFIRADGSWAIPFGGYTTTATAAGTTVLTALSTQTQIFTGSTTQTVTLPVTSTLELGFVYRIVNNSTGAVTVNSSGGGTVLVVRPSCEAVFTCVLTSGTTPASWIQNQITTKSVPQNSQSAAYTTTISDANCHIYHPSADTTARVWTIDSNANVPYPIGTELTFVNDTSAGVITIAITSDTLVLAGAGTTGSRTLAANGIARAIKMTATRWMISGTGLS
jgi:hypothetical protein